MTAQILYFPVHERMASRDAEERLGGIVRFRYPLTEVSQMDRELWFSGWALKKRILIGWSVVNDGLVKAFKGGRVAHLLNNVSVKGDGRPRLEVCCSMQLYPVFNWESFDGIEGIPAVILSANQEKYFRVCQKCGSRMSDLDPYRGIIE